MSIPKRNIAVGILLSVVTCGIYGMYWLFCLAEDVNQLAGRPDATSGGMVLLFSIITCGIYQLYWFYKSGDILDSMREARGRAHGYLGILYLLLAIFGFGIVSYALMQSELNEYAV